MSGGGISFDVQRAVPVAARLLAMRLETTADLPLVAIRDGSPALTGVASGLAAAFRRHGPDLTTELRGSGARLLARTMGRELTRHLLRRNQYLRLPPGWDGVAEDLYAEMLDDLAAQLTPVGDPARATAAHQARLREVLTRAGPQALPAAEPVCADYSPEIQIAVLGVDPRTLPDPILDLGCGETGALVRHLRALGREDTWGLDPLCETGGPLLRGTWFEAPLAPGTWGTIVAHQSFSLHVLRAHTGGTDSEAARLVSLYMRVLRALKPDGYFVYAPALPFLEDLLPADRWKVSRQALTTLGPAGREFHSTCVSRRLMGPALATG